MTTADDARRSPDEARAVTHYEALGLQPDAAPEQVRAAYVALARRHHPDVAGGDADRMRSINDAWSILGDPARRARYDELLQRPVAESPPAARSASVDDRGDLLADLADDQPIGGVVVLPRWLSLVPPAAFALAVGSFCVGAVLGMSWLIGLAVMAFLLSGVFFLAAPFMALFASRRGNR